MSLVVAERAFSPLAVLRRYLSALARRPHAEADDEMWFGRVTREASIGLSIWLCQQSAGALEGKAVLSLGSGCGLDGIAAACTAVGSLKPASCSAVANHGRSRCTPNLRRVLVTSDAAAAVGLAATLKQRQDELSARYA